MVTKKNRKKRWIGSWPANCDICKIDLSTEEVFFDAKSIQGPWGLFCAKCFKTYGLGIGPGKGQMYETCTLEKLGG